MISAIILCVMVFLSSLVIFLGVRYCVFKLDSNESLVFNREFLISLYAKIAFIISLMAIIVFFTANYHLIGLKDPSNDLRWRYILVTIFFMSYLTFYLLFNRKIYEKFSIRSLLGMEHAFGLIIGVSYSIVLSLTFYSLLVI